MTAINQNFWCFTQKNENLCLQKSLPRNTHCSFIGKAHTGDNQDVLEEAGVLISHGTSTLGNICRNKKTDALIHATIQKTV